MGIKELQARWVTTSRSISILSVDLVQQLEHFFMIGSSHQLPSERGGPGEFLNIPAEMFPHQIGADPLPVPIKH